MSYLCNEQTAYTLFSAYLPMNNLTIPLSLMRASDDGQNKIRLHRIYQKPGRETDTRCMNSEPGNRADRKL